MSKAIVFTAIASLFAIAVVADDHGAIGKVMKEGFKGKTSPISKVIDGEATAEETKALAALVRTMHGTKAPEGEQDAYEKKVAELIAAMDEVAGGNASDAAIGRLEKAQNCKACHSEHKPK